MFFVCFVLFCSVFMFYFYFCFGGLSKTGCNALRANVQLAMWPRMPLNSQFFCLSPHMLGLQLCATLPILLSVGMQAQGSLHAGQALCKLNPYFWLFNIDSPSGRCHLAWLLRGPAVIPILCLAVFLASANNPENTVETHPKVG